MKRQRGFVVMQGRAVNADAREGLRTSAQRSLLGGISNIWTTLLRARRFAIGVLIGATVWALIFAAMPN
ncbi:MAG: hypothetical protein ABI831_26980 [Betaproteobacteria bacterium]